MKTARLLATTAPWFVIAVMCVMNGLLVKQNLEMRARLAKAAPAALKQGDKVPAFAGVGFSGEPIRIDYTGREPNRVLLYFTPTCPYCHDQFPIWESLLNTANGNEYQIIGLVSDSEERQRVAEYIKGFHCENLEVVFAPKSVFGDYKLSVTPTTLLIANTGEVKGAWLGKWDSTTLSNVNAALGVRITRKGPSQPAM